MYIARVFLIQVHVCTYVLFIGHKIGEGDIFRAPTHIYDPEKKEFQHFLLTGDTTETVRAQGEKVARF